MIWKRRFHHLRNPENGLFEKTPVSLKGKQVFLFSLLPLSVSPPLPPDYNIRWKNFWEKRFLEFLFCLFLEYRADTIPLRVFVRNLPVLQLPKDNPFPRIRTSAQYKPEQ